MDLYALLRAIEVTCKKSDYIWVKILLVERSDFVLNCMLTIDTSMLSNIN